MFARGKGQDQLISAIKKKKALILAQTLTLKSKRY